MARTKLTARKTTGGKLASKINTKAKQKAKSKNIKNVFKNRSLNEEAKNDTSSNKQPIKLTFVKKSAYKNSSIWFSSKKKKKFLDSDDDDSEDSDFETKDRKRRHMAKEKVERETRSHCELKSAKMSRLGVQIKKFGMESDDEFECLATKIYCHNIDEMIQNENGDGTEIKSGQKIAVQSNEKLSEYEKIRERNIQERKEMLEKMKIASINAKKCKKISKTVRTSSKSNQNNIIRKSKR